MSFILTVDLEEWYHANLLEIPRTKWSECESRVPILTEKLLDLFEQNGVFATFFILGDVARKHASLVKLISQRGHEIASHGMNHELVYTLSHEKFREDVRESKALLEDITGQRVAFYRAPSWSISPTDPENLLILKEEGYLGDSSLQPFKTPLSGNGKTPCEPFYPIINGKQLHLLEVPSTVFDMGTLRMPFAGGFYLRAIPISLIKLGLKLMVNRRPVMVYVHPWELDQSMPSVKVGLFAKFVHYYNVRSTEMKLDHLLRTFSFQPISSLLTNRKHPSLPLGQA